MYQSNKGVLDAQAARGKDTNSIMQGWVDRGPWFYWDTLTCAAGTAMNSSYNPFSVPIGQQNPLVASTTKTKLLTNMTVSNSFPPPRCLLLQQIGFYFSSTMLKTDIDAILDGCYFEFRIDDKIFHEGQMYQYTAGAGLMGVSTQNGESVYTVGMPSPEQTRRFGPWAKYIAPLQQFSMSIIFPGTPPTPLSTGPGVSIKIFLDGLTDRSVQ